MAPKDFDPQLSAVLSLDVQSSAYSKTGTGLDYLTDQFLKDPGLNQNASDADIKAGVDAAARMNAIIIEAIKATGVANDGSIFAADVHEIAGWINTNRFTEWKTQHGDDDTGVETGFHKIQGDGGALHIYGDRTVDQVADGIYHLGFGTRGDRLINEDGATNARVDEVAFWLNDLLAPDLASGNLKNTSVTATVTGSTGTGLDQLIDEITTDTGLNRKVSLDDINSGAAAADAMNKIIIEGIQTLGLGDDKTLTSAEVYELADWINTNRLAPWTAAHGDDANGVETGFHLVQNDGDEGRLFSRDSIDTVADAIYHLGFGYKGDRLINEDGNTNEQVDDVTYWLNELLATDLQSGALATGNSTVPQGSTGTGLDQLVSLITSDAELNRRIPQSELETGASAADAMNVMIVNGIKALGIANNGTFSAGDMMDLSDWIKANHFNAWKAAHGDDALNVETGFHLVQGDGAVTRSYGQNAIDTVADGLYHLGFGYKHGRVTNEDGAGNASLTSVAHWLENLLSNDISTGALDNPGKSPYPDGTTGTGLDAMVDLITTDPKLTRYFKTSELTQIANDVDGLNAILVQAIKATGIANDGNLNALDIQTLGQWIHDNADAQWAALRGDDDTDTGIGGLRWDGAVGHIAGVNGVNSFAPALYGLGFSQKHGGIIDEDGDWVGTATDLAAWLNTVLKTDLAGGTFANSGQSNVDPATFANDLVTGPHNASVTDDDNYVELANSNALRLSEGTVAFTFVAEDPGSNKVQVLFSKDAKGSNEGDTRVYFYNDELYAKFSTGGQDHYIKIPAQVNAGEAHDLALSFGSTGISIWFDGAQVAYRSDIKVNWANNSKDIVVGASNGHQSSTDPDIITNHFQGEVMGFKVYDRALARGEFEGLSSGSSKTGDAGNNNIAGTAGQDALHGGLGRDVLVAGDGDDVAMGGYGADLLKGGKGADVLDGGHGQDNLMGGDGDDILISTSDGREQTPGQLAPGYSKKVRPDNGDLDPATQKLYPNQPIAADDILTGGAGADTFRFQFMINAKFDIIMKHVKSDGTINWRGVAGENTYIHDHWVDMIGDDTITDFNRAEGDRIELAGHTLNIEYIKHLDSDGDGVNDYTKISFISRQGNGGAHDEDALGTLTVYGDLVTMADIDQIPSMSVFYGIVENVVDIDEAITPLEVDNGTARSDPGLNAGTSNGPRGTSDTSGGTAASGPSVPAASRSGTGLDQILDWIETDQGLIDRINTKDIADGSKAAAAMNAIIVEAIKATGAANDGAIDAGDVYGLADWIASNRKAEWTQYHGDDAAGVETGFHLVQNDGGARFEYGRNSINTVADGIYHLGFGYKGDRLINEDGDTNSRVEEVAYWLNDLLSNDLTTNTLINLTVTPQVKGTTGTGLDQLVDLIQTDSELSRNIPDSEQQGGAAAANTMNKIIVDGIKALGLANDGALTASDVMALSDHIRANDLAAWTAAHGDDAGSVETGFHLVQGDGARAQLFGDKAIDTVADGLYHLGFGYKNGRLTNEDGNSNARVEEVAHWLNQLLSGDMASLTNTSVDPTPPGQTNTGLDQLVDMIQSDAGLNNRVSLGEISTGADAANTMNEIIVQSIHATGIGNNGQITVSDVMTLSDHIKANYAAQWKIAHGDDATASETGFHKVQNDGAQTQLFGRNAIDTVADGLYHLGFGHKNGRLINEDGDANASLSDVAGWLDQLIAGDLGGTALQNASVNAYVSGSTGTGLDALVDMITADTGLQGSLKTTDIAKAATAADKLNKILVEGIKATGIANDGAIDKFDVMDLDAWVRGTHLSELKTLSGQNGFNIAEIWQSASPLFGKSGVNDVADTIYNIGFGTKWGNSLLNETGNWQAHLDDAASWLSGLLAQDLHNGNLYNAAKGYTAPSTFNSDIVMQPLGDVTADGATGHLNVIHQSKYQLQEGTVSFDVNANYVPKGSSVTLFSKDARDYGGGGHTQVYLDKGELSVRIQSNAKSYYIKAEAPALQAGTNYHVALVFGTAGLQLFLDGNKVLNRPDLKIDWTQNNEDIVFGGSGDWRNSNHPDHVHSVFDGTISNATLYDRGLHQGEVAGLAGVNNDVVSTGGTPPITPPTPTPPTGGTPTVPDPGTPTVPTPDPTVPTTPIVDLGSQSDDSLDGGTGNDRLLGQSGQDTLDGGDGNDLLNGGLDNDVLTGGDGRDRLLGGSGDDTLNAGSGDDTMFGDKGDDSLDGGSGKDRLDGGLGNDTMTGGADGDTFILAFGGGDQDIITDLDFSQDELILRSFNGNGQVIVKSEADLFGLNLAGLTISDTGADTLLTFDMAGETHTTLLKGIDDPLTAG